MAHSATEKTILFYFYTTTFLYSFTYIIYTFLYISSSWFYIYYITTIMQFIEVGVFPRHCK